jgi:hypothetical protein
MVTVKVMVQLVLALLSLVHWFPGSALTRQPHHDSAGGGVR